MKDTKEMIAVMQAYADGKQIEWQGYGESVWQEAADPWWDWVHMDYRIKPGPKIRFMTHRELARWCAGGKGQLKYGDGSIAFTEHSYSEDDNEEVTDILIRSWDETEWHKPEVEVEE